MLIWCIKIIINQRNIRITTFVFPQPLCSLHSESRPRLFYFPFCSCHSLESSCILYQQIKICVSYGYLIELVSFQWLIIQSINIWILINSGEMQLTAQKHPRHQLQLATLCSHKILRGSPLQTRKCMLRCIKNGRPQCQAFTGPGGISKVGKL